MSKLDSKKKLSTVEKLRNLCLSLQASSDQIEDVFWEKKILDLLQTEFSPRKQKILDKTLDLLQKESPDAYSTLIELIETSTQALCISSNINANEKVQTLLIASPILVWTGYKIPSGTLSIEIAQKLQKAFNDFILASESQSVFYRHLFTSEDLPESHIEIFQLTKKLGKSLHRKQYLTKNKQKTKESPNTFTDIRYIIGLVGVTPGSALFQWQTTNSDGVYLTKETCLANWENALHSIFNSYFIGCEFKSILPNAFYSACREANEEIRSHTIIHAVNYLAEILSIETENLRAVIGGFGEETIEEFRIGLTKRGDNKNIYHGIIWPLYQNEEFTNKQQIDDINELTLEKIKKILKNAGVKEIRHHPNFFNLEYLDEEGNAPLFPNGFGELSFAELPTEDEKASNQFH